MHRVISSEEGARGTLVGLAPGPRAGRDPMMATVMDRSAAEVTPGPSVPSPTASAPSAGVLDLYRSIGAAALVAVHRYRLAIVVEGLLIVAYLVLRTEDATDIALVRWLVVACAIAIVSPTSGLVVLAAVAPFNEGLALTRDIGSKSVLAAAVLVGIAVRIAIHPRRLLRLRVKTPAVASVLLASALFVVSAASLFRTWQRWGDDFVQAAAQVWLQGIGTMLVVFICAVWVARRGEVRPIVVAIVATVAAGVISLVDFASDATLRMGPLGWAVAGAFNPERLTGVIRSPTSTAALVMLPICVLVAGAVLARNRRLQIGAAIAAGPLIVAAYLTYNRAVFLALFVLAVAITWRIRRGLGAATLVAGLIAGALVIPPYLAARGSLLGGPATVVPGQILIASDQQRLTAWAAAGRMFLDQPAVGQGYRAYRQLSVQFGDPVLNAPHNEWLRFFAEGGVVNGVVALAFVAVTGVALLRRRGWLETGLFAAFASLCLAAAFNNPFLFNQVTIPGFLLAGAGVGLAHRAITEPVSASA